VVCLSVLLVVVTALVVGGLLVTVVPGLPFAAACALGAALAPPDAVSALSIGRRVGLPDRLRTVIEGESLLNDATALTLYTVAVAAVVGGPFDVPFVIGQFLVATLGGIAGGSPSPGSSGGCGVGSRSRSPRRPSPWRPRQPRPAYERCDASRSTNQSPTSSPNGSAEPRRTQTTQRGQPDSAEHPRRRTDPPREPDRHLQPSTTRHDRGRARRDAALARHRTALRRLPPPPRKRTRPRRRRASPSLNRLFREASGPDPAPRPSERDEPAVLPSPVPGPRTTDDHQKPPSALPTVGDCSEARARTGLEPD